MKIEKKTQMEWLLLAYFIVVLAHSAIPYLKFFLWLSIIIMTVIMMMKNGIAYIQRKNILMVILSYGMFLILVYLSKNWAYVQRPNAGIIETMVRILPVLIVLAYYINSQEKIHKIIDIFIIAAAYFAIIYIITSPVSTYGTTAMKGITEQHRNFSAYLSAMNIILSYYMFDLTKKKKYTVCMICSLALVIIAGSRGAIFSLAVMIVLYLLFQRSLNKRMRNFLIALVVVLIGSYILLTNNYFYQIYGKRIFEMLSNKDSSAEDRSYYIEVAFQMFLQKPILGWGIDNFSYYLNIFGHYGREVYSHCNYAEILSCYGIVGFVFYYWPYFVTIKKQWSTRYSNKLSKVLLILMIRFFIFEYSTISFEHIMYMSVLTLLFCGSNVLNYERNMQNEKNNLLSQESISDI